MLSTAQLENICLAWDGSSETCRYLRADDKDYDKFYCLKLRKDERQKIDGKLNIFVRDCRKNGKDPEAQAVPMGDNCKGYPLLKHVEQGYDQP